MASLDQRLSGLTAGDFDATLSSLSFTPGREAVVHFVRPFYFSSGVALFGNNANLQPNVPLFGVGGYAAAAGSGNASASSGWKGLFSSTFHSRETLCMVKGYYALPFVEEVGGRGRVAAAEQLPEAWLSLAAAGSFRDIRLPGLAHEQDLNIDVDISDTLDEAVDKTRSGEAAGSFDPLCRIASAAPTPQMPCTASNSQLFHLRRQVPCRCIRQHHSRLSRGPASAECASCLHLAIWACNLERRPGLRARAASGVCDDGSHEPRQCQHNPSAREKVVGAARHWPQQAGG